MSLARPSLLSAGAVLALTLAAPGAASADPGPGKADAEKGGKAGQSSPADRPSDDDRSQRSADEARGSDRPQEAPRGTSPRKGPRPGGTAPKGDPRGNNGTIKIDTVPADEARANRPHPGCTFALTFFGFDADQHADITFTAQAPTAGGTLLSLSDRLISTTPADGSMESDHTLVLSAADLGLVGTPQAAQGWHVKVAVDAVEAPGGAKQKVFWLDCPQEAAPAEQPPATGATADTTTDTDTDSVVSPAALDRAAADTSVGVLGTAATRRMLDQVGSPAAPARATAAGQAAAGQAGASTDRASVVPFGTPDTLPFTGPAGVALALATGLAAVGAGTLALRAGRRRATS